MPDALFRLPLMPTPACARCYAACSVPRVPIIDIDLIYIYAPVPCHAMLTPTHISFFRLYARMPRVMLICDAALMLICC